MRIIYNEKYPLIDSNMSDGQMGGRKGKGCRNNIFIINGLIHDILSSKHKKPAIFQIYDYSQMFDSINLQQAISDIYEAGLTDVNLSLIYQANKEIFMAVNTPGGLSDRQTIENIVLQGDTWGSLLASVQVDSIAQECAETGLGYKYKNILPVGMLGLVDDTIGITKAGYKTHMFNTFFNIKTAEKGLQFGANKCKSMLVGRNVENILDSTMCVDKWNVEHVEDKQTGDTQLVETFAGQVDIAKCSEQKYLGFIISSSGDIMANIRSLKNKSIGIIKKIFTELNSLHLQKYYFECGVMFLHIMLRSSILYACETYYNLKENEMRQIERIEETYMRQLLKTRKGCPIKQMYLELGFYPARFDIYKLRLFFLKDILNQNQDSMMLKFLQLQVDNPVKGDWASTCSKNLKDLNINLSFEDIKGMSAYKYKQLVKLKCKESSFNYLMKKRGSKGIEINYPGLEMAAYLQPNNVFTIDDQQKIFEIRNKLSDIPSNFCKKENNKSKCVCSEIETMEHIYSCYILNKETPDIEYEKVYSDKLYEQKVILERFEANFNKRKEYLNKEDSPHVILDDPLLSTLLDYSTG